MKLNQIAVFLNHMPLVSPLKGFVLASWESAFVGTSLQLWTLAASCGHRATWPGLCCLEAQAMVASSSRSFVVGGTGAAGQGGSRGRRPVCLSHLFLCLCNQWFMQVQYYQCVYQCVCVCVPECDSSHAFNWSSKEGVHSAASEVGLFGHIPYGCSAHRRMTA
jgi:hypothetical protein